MAGGGGCVEIKVCRPPAGLEPKAQTDIEVAFPG
jgi:hypothetical protein